MPDWKILIADGLEANGQALLRAAAQVDDRRGIGADELLQVIADYDALIVRSRTRISGAVLSATSRLKVIGRAGVGVDNIDLAAAQVRGVTVINTPTATSLAVAELALGLILALARAIPRADAAAKNGQWLKKELLGVEISGKTLGVIGMGNIGAALARGAAALGMQVLGYDAFMPAEEISRREARPASLAELYARSDFISLHVPLTPETRHLIDAAALDQMKAGVRLVCTARGGIIDEAAVLQALLSGKVAGAALDVFDQEPPGQSPLVLHPNVIVTPHIGAQTVEAQTRAAEDLAHEVIAALHGQPLRWKVI
ncbi:MAG: hydroxyacid dehydrogenase [Chloroflexota bacterium]